MTSTYDSVWGTFLRLESPSDHFLVPVPREENPYRLKARIFSALRDRVMKEQLFDRWPVIDIKHYSGPVNHLQISYKSKV